MAINRADFRERIFVQIVKDSCRVCGVWFHEPSIEERKEAYSRWLGESVNQIKDLDVLTKLEIHHQYPSEREIMNTFRGNTLF